MEEVYHSSFARTVYAGILSGLSFDYSSRDVARILDMCTQTEIDVDLTCYLNVQTLLTQEREKCDIKILATDKPFPRVMDRFFGQFQQELNCYFHLPATLNSANVRDEAILQHAKHPLFLRTECSYSRLKMIDAEHSHIPFVTLPKSYRVSGDDSNDESDYTPAVIGTSNSPIESADGTKALLHLCCLWIPTGLEHERPLSPASDDVMGYYSPRLNMDEEATKISKIPEQNRADVARLIYAIKWLLVDEIIFGLLQLTPTHSNAFRFLEYIETELVQRHRYPDQHSELQMVETDECWMSSGDECKSVMMCIPLHLVRDSDQAIRLLQTEFLCGELELAQFGDYFVASGWRKSVGKIIRVIKSANFVNGTAEAIISDDTKICGLGIAIEDPVGRVAEQEPTDSSVSVSDDARMFWVVLRLVNDAVEVFVFSNDYLGTSQESLCTVILQNIAECVEKVNNRILLQELNETKIASEFLIAREEDNSTEHSDHSDDDDATRNHNQSRRKFEEGEFACDLVFQHAFHLHPRLNPNNVLNAICTDLQPFIIHNRKNMFVIPTRCDIYYIHCHSSEAEAPYLLDRATGSTAAVVAAREDSNSYRGQLINSPQTAFPAKAEGEVGSPNWSAKITPIALVIIMEVHGINYPSAEITENLVTMIGTKILQLTQSSLGIYLSRNVFAKLTASDVDYFLPRYPHSPEVLEGQRKVNAVLPDYPQSPKTWQMDYVNTEFPLSGAVRNPYLFMHLMRQNVLVDSATAIASRGSSFGLQNQIAMGSAPRVGYLYAFMGAEVSKNLQKHYGEFGIKVQTSRLNEGDIQIQLDEFTFLYNGTHGKHSGLEYQLGNGFATISFQLLHRSHKEIISAFPSLAADGYPLKGKDTVNPGNPVAEHEALSPASSVSSSLESDFHYIVDALGLSVKERPLSEFEISSKPGFLGEYVLGVEIWSQKDVNAKSLIEKIFSSFKEAENDYFIEAAVTRLTYSLRKSAIPEALSHSQINLQIPVDAEAQESALQYAIPITHGKDNVRVSTGTRIDKSFSEFMFVAEKLFERSELMNSVTVQNLTTPINFPTWIADDLISEVRDILTFASGGNGKDVTSKIYPVVAKQIIFTDLDSSGYRPFSENKQSSAVYEVYQKVAEGMLEPAQSYVAVIGLKELEELYAPPTFMRQTSLLRNNSTLSARSVSTTTSQVPRTVASPEVEVSGDGTASEQSGEQLGGNSSENPTANNATSAAPPKLKPVESSLIGTSAFPELYSVKYPELGKRSSFIMVFIGSSQFRVHAYNIAQHHCENMLNHLWRLLTWNNLRMQYLQRELALLTPLRPFAHREGVASSILSESLFPLQPAMVSQRVHDVRTIVSGVGSFGGQSSSVQYDLSSDVGRVNLYSTESDPNQRTLVTFLVYFVRDVFLKYNITAVESSNTDVDSSKNLDVARKIHEPLTYSRSLASIPYLFTPNLERPQLPRFVKTASVHATLQSTYWSLMDMALILRSVQFFHSARYPLMFSEIFNSSNADLQSAPSPVDCAYRDPYSPVSTTCYKELTDRFVTEYVEYLLSLQMEIVEFKPSAKDSLGFGGSLPASETPPQFVINPGSLMDTQFKFLTKRCKQGVIVAHVGIDSIHACLGLYTIRYLHSERAPSEGSNLASGLSQGGGSGLRETDSFTSDCQQFRVDVHFNSFAFDFHIRYYQQMLDGRFDAPSGMDLLECIIAFNRFNPRHPQYARSRMHQAVLTLNASNLSDLIFHYILKNTKRYGFKKILRDGDPVACYLSSDSPEFLAQHGNPDAKTADFKISVIAYVDNFTFPFSMLPIDLL